MVKVTNTSLVISGANRATANVDWTISGINLENIASLTIGSEFVADCFVNGVIFVGKSVGQMSLP